MTARYDWTSENQYQALAEGWGVFNVDSRDIYRIRRWDEAEIFTSDSAAITYVKSAAANGHRLAISALEFLESKMEDVQ